MTTPSTLQIAVEHHQAGRLAEAEQLYRRVLTAEPNNADALHLLGLVAHQLGRNESAVELIEKAHRAQRAQPASLMNLGMAYLGLRRLPEARKCFAKALALKPDFAEAHCALGAALRALGQHDEAAKSLRRAVALRPDYAEAHANLASALAALGRPQEAEQNFRRALSLKPDDFETHVGLADMLHDYGRLDEAAEAYRKALALKPDHAEAHNNLAIVLAALGHAAEAEQSYRKALALRSDSVQAHVNLGYLLYDLGRMHEAAQCYAEALRLEPDHAEARWAFTVSQLPAVCTEEGEPERCRTAFSAELARLIEWFDANPDGDGFRAVGVRYPFYLAYQEDNNRELLSAYGDLCARLMRRWQDAQRFPAIRRVARPDGAVVRVGIASAHIYDHSVWNAIVRGWIQHLERSRFEICMFNLGSRRDEETQFARTHASEFVEGKRNLRQWVDAIRGEQPDVLIYPELGMDEMTAKLAGLRLAPVQAATWGHPETTGLPTIDYYLSAEAFEPPGAQENYSERLVKLANLGCCCRSLVGESRDPDLAALGIEADAPLLVCAGTPYKYAPRYDWVFPEIARKLGRCRFIFFTRLPEYTSERLCHRLQTAFTRAQMNFDDYVVFIPRLPGAEFHGLMKRADVYLDTIGFSGFNSAMQAVEFSLPIVTREGRFMRGRFAGGILKQLGLPELIAATEQEYVESAVKLARDPDYRRQIRARIEASRQSLFEDLAPIRALEAFLLDAQARHR